MLPELVGKQGDPLAMLLAAGNVNRGEVIENKMENPGRIGRCRATEGRILNL
jgi:hypothetical protein